MTTAIQTTALTKHFARNVGYRSLLVPWRRSFTTALHSVDIEVEQGHVCGLLGPNGAGKTTLLKVLATLVLPNEGRAEVLGHDVAREAKTVRKLVGYVVAEERSFYWRLTGRQNLQFFGALNSLKRRPLRARIEELADLLGVESVLDTRVSAYSAGMRQKLAVARALLADPEVLLMDEPTRSLDPAMSQRLLRFIREDYAGRRGGTVLMASHQVEEVRTVCDHVLMLEDGQVRAAGPPASLLPVNGAAAHVTVDAHRLPAEAEALLRALPGVVQVASRPANGHGPMLQVTLDEPPTQLSQVLESITRAGGMVSSVERDGLGLRAEPQPVAEGRG